MTGTSQRQQVTTPQVSIFSSFEALHEALALHQIELTADADFFCTLPWFENLACHGLELPLNASSDLRLVLAKDTAKGVLFALPLLSGGSLTSLSNYYSSLYGPVVLRASPPQKSAPSTLSAGFSACCDAVCRQLRADPAQWPSITLSPLDAQSPFFHHMLTALKRAGYWTDRFFCFGNWYLQVAGRSFDTYQATLPSALRNSLARGQKKLSKQGNWHIHIQQENDANLENAIAAFTKVYALSWKSAEPNASFIPNLIRMAAAQGWLRLGILTLSNDVIAAQLWLVKSNKASIYKLAYVKGFEQFSPGSLLTQALMRQVIDVDGVTEVDYLTGDDAYKRDWMSHRRERWGIVAFHLGTLRGTWLAARHAMGKLIKTRGIS